MYLEKGLLLFYGNLYYLIWFSVVAPYTQLALALKKNLIYSATVVLDFILSLICWVVFLPSLNIIGIDLGKWIYLLPQAIILRFFINKSHKLGKMSVKNILNLVSLIILSIISFLLIFNFETFLSRIIIFFIVTSIYILLLLCTKVISKTDIRNILNIFNPKKMINYIKSELDFFT